MLLFLSGKSVSKASPHPNNVKLGSYLFHHFTVKHHFPILSAVLSVILLFPLPSLSSKSLSSLSSFFFFNPLRPGCFFLDGWEECENDSHRTYSLLPLCLPWITGTDQSSADEKMPTSYSEWAPIQDLSVQCMFFLKQDAPTQQSL